MSIAQESAASLTQPLLHITPPRGWLDLDLREVWSARELLYFFVWRDVKVRYKQTAIGVAWAVLQPLLNMVVFSLFFGKLAKIPSGGSPYPVFYYCALLPWTYFATALASATTTAVHAMRSRDRLTCLIVRIPPTSGVFAPRGARAPRYPLRPRSGPAARNCRSGGRATGTGTRKTRLPGEAT